MSLPLTNLAVTYRTDNDERVRFINQYSAPFTLPDGDPDNSPTHLVELYLNDAINDYGFNDTILNELNTPPEIDLNKNYLQLRLLDVVSRQAIDIAFYVQTCYGIPLWNKSLSLTIADEPFGVIRCISTFAYEVTMNAPNPQTIDNYSAITNTELADLLNTNDPDSITINNSEHIHIYQYNPDARLQGSLSGGYTVYDTDDLPAVSISLIVEELHHPNFSI